MRRRFRTPLAGCLVTIITFASTQAETVTLESSRDNTLYQSPAGALSNGAGAHFFVGRTGQLFNSIRRGLLRFDVAGAVPPGSRIGSAVLTLNVSMTINGSQPIALHRCNADWGEGASDASAEEGGGAAAAPGDATWLHRSFDAVRWASPGGDFAPEASATTPVVLDAQYTWGSTPAMVADVQDWLDNDAANYGWVLTGNESAGFSAKRFDTREEPNPANRPRLTITYTPITDCNANGIDDAQDIAGGASQDCNADGRPDECEPDTDADGRIDACDGCPSDPLKTAPGACGCGAGEGDRDGDRVPDCRDGCPDDPSKTAPGALGCGVAETDSDGDGAPDAVDQCPGVDDHLDSDSDGTPDCMDGCPNDALKVDPGACGCAAPDADGDGDGVPNCRDNCVAVANADQTDADGDGLGDACETAAAPGNDDQNSDADQVAPEDDIEAESMTPDADEDGVGDELDNCPQTGNPNQADSDGDGIGDYCDDIRGCAPCGPLGLPGFCVSILTYAACRRYRRNHPDR